MLLILFSNLVMIKKIEFLRVALFADSYLEVDGAALTCRKLVGFAQERGYPFLCVHAGEKTEQTESGTVTHLSLKRSPFAIRMDETLAYDPFLSRHLKRIEAELDEFQPDVIHLTGLNDVSNLAAWIAHKRKIPLIGSWHTNLHEFASRRLKKIFRFLPDQFVAKMTNLVEKEILKWAIYYYKMPKVVLAPNADLVEAIAKGSGRTTNLMSRGVDTDFFSPNKRVVSDDIFRLGFVGRLRAEKNIKLLADLEKRLIEFGQTNFKFLIVGEGNEREYLEKTMKNAEFTGFLQGEKLAEAYSNLDVFIFPSETDAFGNVVQEAMASGVPVIVTNQGGPKFLVKHGQNGYIAENIDDFVKYSVELMQNPEKLAGVKKFAREEVISKSWDTVFEKVYESYHQTFEIAQVIEFQKQLKEVV